jgi:protein-tyrosine phosphatase
LIDPHIHVLPAVDDGARSRDISRELIHRMASSGYSTLIATPHVTDIPKPSYEQLGKNAFDDIVPVAREYGVELLPGYEVLLTPHTAEHLRNGAPLTLGGSKTVLVEVTMAGWPAFTEQILYEIQIAGFTPILAHPERYPAVLSDPSIAISLAERGVLLQATIGSLNGLFGRAVTKVTEMLLTSGAISILASDAHGVGQRAESIPRGIERAKDLVGAERVAQLTTDNMKALLQCNPLPEPAPVALSSSKRRWSLPGRRS